MTRADAFGFFWEEKPQVKKQGSKIPRTRVAPPIPETGWKPPKTFPRLDSTKLIGFDIETKDLDIKTKGPGVRRGAEIIGLSVATEDRGWYFPMRHTLGPNLDPAKVLAWAASKQGLANSSIKIGTNPLYDLDFLEEAGVKVGGTVYDVQVIEALLDENRKAYDLDTLATYWLGEGKNSAAAEDWIQQAYGTGEDFRAHLWQTPSQLVGPYAESDAVLPLRLFHAQMKSIREQGLEEVLSIETRLIPLLLAMRRRGVRIDLAEASQVDEELTELEQQDSKLLTSVVGREVNVNAAEDIARAFDAARIVYPTTATNKPSFTKSFLEHHEHPIAQAVCRIRKWRKFRDTFIRGYLFELHVKERIHCLFHQARSDEYGTVSGRFSSSLPNLQNIPHRDAQWGQRIRSIFKPEPGEAWVKFDWSQIEFRILTHYGKGDSAEQAQTLYNNDASTDFHSMVAGMTGVERGPAKNINFGLVYGMGKALLASQIGVPLHEAEPIFEQYHERFGFVREAYEQANYLAQRDGYIQTLLGRRRRFDLWEQRKNQGKRIALTLDAARIQWGDGIRRAYTHKALNSLIQGSAADLMKKAMVDIWESGICAVLGAPLITVHDELDWSAPKTRKAKQALQEVKHIMETCMKLSVPILAERTDGIDWGTTDE